jgi:hypothetical protein
MRERYDLASSSAAAGAHATGPTDPDGDQVPAGQAVQDESPASDQLDSGHGVQPGPALPTGQPETSSSAAASSRAAVGAHASLLTDADGHQ